MTAPQHRIDLEAPVVLASALDRHAAAASRGRRADGRRAAGPVAAQIMHVASLKRDTASDEPRAIVVAEAVQACDRRTCRQAARQAAATPAEACRSRAGEADAAAKAKPTAQPAKKPADTARDKAVAADPLAPLPCRPSRKTAATANLQGSRPRRNERAHARFRRPTARAAPACRTAPPDPRRHAPAADVRHAGLCRRHRADRRADPLPRRVRRPCRAARRDHDPGARARRHRRPRRPSAGADDRRLDDRHPPDQDHRRQARDRAGAGAADAGARRSDLFRDAAVGQELLLPAPPRARRAWSRRSTRSASRASRSTASPTGSTRRPALPPMSSATPTSTAMASPAWSGRSTSNCRTPRPAASR